MIEMRSGKKQYKVGVWGSASDSHCQLLLSPNNPFPRSAVLNKKHTSTRHPTEWHLAFCITDSLSCAFEANATNVQEIYSDTMQSPLRDPGASAAPKENTGANSAPSEFEFTFESSTLLIEPDVGY